MIKGQGRGGCQNLPCMCATTMPHASQQSSAQPFFVMIRNIGELQGSAMGLGSTKRPVLAGEERNKPKLSAEQEHHTHICTITASIPTAQA